MKKFTVSILMIVFTLVLTSCSILTKRTMWAAPADNPPLEIMNSIQADVIVDKSKTLSGTASHSIFLGIFQSGDNKYADLPSKGMSKTKEAAIFKALDGTGNDILVNPKFNVVIDKTLISKKVTVSVVGYGAKYVVR